MESQEEQFLAMLREAFAIEAVEHLEGLEAGLIELEKLKDDAARAPFVEKIYREIHSLKGAARAVDNAPIEAICQALENLLAVWKRGELEVSPELFDVLHQASDIAGEILLQPAAAPNTAPQSGEVSDIVARVTAVLESSQAQSLPHRAVMPAPQIQPDAENYSESVDKSDTEILNSLAGNLLVSADNFSREIKTVDEVKTVDGIEVVVHSPEHLPIHKKSDVIVVQPLPATKNEGVVTDETVRIKAAKLDELLRGAEELLVWKQIAGERAAELREMNAQFKLWRREWQKIAPQVSVAPRIGSEKELVANGVLDFLRWNEILMSDLEDRVAEVTRASEGDRRALGGLIDNLLDEAKQLLMLPFSHISGVFARVVRDVAREQGKEIEFELRGEDVELDKRILEALKEPLIHLLRNSVDHGVETPSEREKRGKPRIAFITLCLAQSGGEVEISLSDNGGGIDETAVKNSALRAGLISLEEAERLTPDAARWLIFQSSLSTSPLITEISGRGLGMTIVREKVEALGGRIELESEIGAGTTFRLFLPLTLATFRGVLVETRGQKFVLPAADVERVVRVAPADLGLIHGQATLTLPREERQQEAHDKKGRDLISYANLSEILALRSAGPAPTLSQLKSSEWKIAIVLRRSDARLAVEVEKVCGEQEILVKPLPCPLVRVKNIAGATILGSGQVVPILNVADLFQSAQKIRGVAPLSPAENEAAPRRILVAEDSITSRMLLKNILESAGYQVTTAVDGLNALNLLQGSDFDLLVSDVDMPHLSGLDLTARIRAEPKLSAIPVVLVTSRSTKEDRERGVDVGANAYIVKSRFDQNDLLEVVARFI
ncbi:CheA signal transduction histidine kinase [Abditibacterium utsteinense]|uniref:histidine kinase n=2 Tax=Abditibacterium utsteinense TaxID=1960156 RepID=A0A2S8STT6_9BACT|nr:CheA signal transduction histidine kinase [Abditibacterium utsteinense]